MVKGPGVNLISIGQRKVETGIQQIIGKPTTPGITREKL